MTEAGRALEEYGRRAKNAAGLERRPPGAKDRVVDPEAAGLRFRALVERAPDGPDGTADAAAATEALEQFIGDPDDEEGLGAGGGVEFRKLAMQPGKPQGFGTIGPDHTPLLALPGNPVSSYVSFEMFVRPAVRALMGLPDVHRATARARLTADKALTSPAGRRQFLRGRHDADAGTVTPVGGSGSHLIAALAHADALIVVPEDTTSVEPGTDVDVVLLG